MSTSDVTREGLKGVQPGRDAMVGVPGGKRRRGGEQPVVPDAKFSSYYGKPVINQPVWKAPDIAGYFYLGGLAGASSVLGLGAHITDRPALAKSCKLGALGAISLGTVGLVHDLPEVRLRERDPRHPSAGQRHQLVHVRAGPRDRRDRPAARLRPGQTPPATVNG